MIGAGTRNICITSWNHTEPILRYTMLEVNMLFAQQSPAYVGPRCTLLCKRLGINLYSYRSIAYYYCPIAFNVLVLCSESDVAINNRFHALISVLLRCATCFRELSLLLIDLMHPDILYEQS